MSYTPNTSDPRVIKRINKAVKFVECYVHNKPNWLSRNHIDRYFGSHELGMWLRSKLLLVVDEHYDMKLGKCKTYQRNHRGYNQVLRLLNPQLTSTDDTILTAEQIHQLETGQFTYTEVNERYYNNLQNLATSIRKPKLSEYGYKYNYDIVCAAPTLIRQWAGKLGLKSTTPALDEYIHNRSQIRLRLSRELEITPKQAKKLIHSLVNGAPISLNYRSSIFNQMNRDPARIEWLKQDVWIQQLVNDVRECWRAIKPHTPKTSMRFTAQAKSRVYRLIERDVMRQVYKRLKYQRVDIRVFNEHDGWRCDQLVDQNDLRAHVKRTTGYVVDFDYEVCEYA